MNETVTKLLLKQLQLLSEQSHSGDVLIEALSGISNAMVQIAKLVLEQPQD
jgi:hypothetical protein